MALTQGLVDTSVFVAFESGRVVARNRMPAEIIVSVISVGELRAGVLATNVPEIRAQRLDTLALALSFESIPIDDAVASAWALLRVSLRSAGRSMPVNDSWIAATAISLGVPVVTQDDDYEDIPGLQVIRV